MSIPNNFDFHHGLLSADTPEQARLTVSELGITYSILLDSSRTHIRAYDVLHPQEGIARPSLFVLDRDGVVPLAIRRYECCGPAGSWGRSGATTRTSVGGQNCSTTAHAPERRLLSRSLERSPDKAEFEVGEDLTMKTNDRSALDRRSFLERSALTLLAASAPLAGNAQQPRATEPTSSTLRFFPGFESIRIETSGAVINGIKGGSGSPLLLLHGFLRLSGVASSGPDAVPALHDRRD